MNIYIADFVNAIIITATFPLVNQFVVRFDNTGTVYFFILLKINILSYHLHGQLHIN